MKNSERILNNPIYEVKVYIDNSFKEELDKIMSLGFSEPQAGCYVSSYHDEYICDTHNGGCDSRKECEILSQKLMMIAQ